MKIQSFFIGFLLATLIALTAYVATADKPGLLGGSTQAFYGSATNSSAGVSSTPTLILAAADGRLSADICNPSGNATVWISEFAGGVTPTTTVGSVTRLATSIGRMLPASSCYQINADNLSTGAVWGISASLASSSQTVAVKQTAGR